MRFKPDIFKAYDIRGKFPEEIHEEVAQRLGRALVLYFSKKEKKRTVDLLICHDVRLSSPALKQALAHGILSQGGNVIDAGTGTTPYFYYLMHTVGADGGAMVTASHNPPTYNGFKIRDREGRPVSGTGGLTRIKMCLQKLKKEKYPQLGTITLLEDRRRAYLDFLSQGITIKKQIRAVVDAAGGSTAYFLPELFHRFPSIHYKPIFFEPDGSFRKHPPNPLLPESRRHVIASLKAGSFDCGVLFDGDGDRVLFFDEQGNHVSGEFIMALWARDVLKKKRGEKFIFPVNTSKGAREYVAEHGGKIILSPVGYARINQIFRKEKAYGGAEISGHFYFRDFFNDDSGIFAMLKLFETLASSAQPLSRLVAPMRRYVSSGEINFRVKDKKSVLAKMNHYYKKLGAAISRLDGLTIEFPDWWASVRASNTEPLVRVVVEAQDNHLLAQKTKELQKLIQ